MFYLISFKNRLSISISHTKIHLFFLFSSYIFVSFCCGTFSLVEESLNFITIGDWGRTRSSGVPNKQDDVARQMDIWAREHNLEFILTLGDNFYPDGVFSSDDEQFETKWRNVID